MIRVDAEILTSKLEISNLFYLTSFSSCGILKRIKEYTREERL